MGKWPKRDAGAIVGAKFETWYGVDRALCCGYRGFAGGSSLARLLAEERGARNHMRLAPLSEERILEWADEHHKRTGSWPKATSGKIPGARGEKWRGIEDYLRHGLRGLPGGFLPGEAVGEAAGSTQSKRPSVPKRGGDPCLGGRALPAQRRLAERGFRIYRGRAWRNLDGSRNGADQRAARLTWGIIPRFAVGPKARNAKHP